MQVRPGQAASKPQTPEKSHAMQGWCWMLKAILVWEQLSKKVLFACNPWNIPSCDCTNTYFLRVPPRSRSRRGRGHPRSRRRGRRDRSRSSLGPRPFRLFSGHHKIEDFFLQVSGWIFYYKVRQLLYTRVNPVKGIIVKLVDRVLLTLFLPL